MFCPNCGRDDSHTHKFCPSCGTNLDVVTLALTTGEDSLFTRVNKHLDRSVARYADHFFDDAQTKAREGGVGNSWRLVGKGILTYIIDLILLPLMFFFIPFRIFILMLYTPFGLLQQRGERKRRSLPAVDAAREASKQGLLEPGGWRVDSVASVTENTTVHLATPESKRERINTSDPLTGKPRISTR